MAGHHKVDRSATSAKQSTITKHFTTSKTLPIFEKRSVADDSMIQAEQTRISPKRFKTSHLQLSEHDVVGIDCKRDSSGDDVELSQCCTQPLLSQQWVEEGETTAAVAGANIYARNTAWLHQQYCISGQVRVQYGIMSMMQVTGSRWFPFQNSVPWFDSVHGHFEVPELCVAIINTPQFQVPH